MEFKFFQGVNARGLILLRRTTDHKGNLLLAILWIRVGDHALIRGGVLQLLLHREKHLDMPLLHILHGGTALVRIQ